MDAGAVTATGTAARGGLLRGAISRPMLFFFILGVTFAVMASGITSASTLSRAFGGDYLQEFISVPTTIAALVFLVIVALINFGGIRESVRTNMVLTLVEVTGLAIIVIIGLFALGNADTEVGRNFEFKAGEGAFLAILAGTALAFYALIGFEDSAIALLAIANGALINLVMASRLLYGMSNEGILPRAFSTTHPDRRTPWVAIVFTTGISSRRASSRSWAW